MALSTLPVSTLAVIGLVFILCYRLYLAALPRVIPGIPHHKASAKSVLGDLPSLLKYQKDTLEVQSWTVQQCLLLNSPIVQLFVRPFSPPWVVLVDFREGQDIFMRRTKEFDRSNIFGDFFLGVLPNHHISMPSNETWKYQRRLLTDIMTPSFLQEVATPQIYATTLDLLELWRLKITLSKGHPFTAPHDIYHTALDAIWAVAFGSEVGTTQSQIKLLSTLQNLDLPDSKDLPVEFPKAPTPPAFDAIITLTDSVETTLKSPFPRPHHWLLRQLPYMRSAKARKDHLIDEKIKEALKKFSSTANKDESIKSAVEHMLYRELAAAKKEGREPAYNTPAAKDEIFGLLIAGHETTSTTVIWGIKFFTDHQEVQHKLRQALRAEFISSFANNSNPSAEAIARCQIPYLDATIEEILRCGATAAGLSRVTKVDIEVLGFRIPKGTDIFSMSIGPSFKSKSFEIDESLRSQSSQSAKDRTGTWNNADIGLFKPERWLTKDETGETVFDSRAGPTMPFGLGPRGCFGRKLAELELRILLVLLIWNFEFLPTPANLSSYKAVDRITHQPQQCFVRLAPAK